MVKRATGLTDYWFDPTRLIAAEKNGNVASFKVAQVDAQRRRHNQSKSDVGLKVLTTEHAQLQPRGLQGVFEAGREAGYPINAGGDTGLRRSRVKGTTVYRVRAGSGGGVYLGFNNTPGTDSGTGVRYGPVLGGKMRKYPAMQPAGVDWARRGYAATQRRVLAAQGFGRSA
jgi:hypothetical protein